MVFSKITLWYLASKEQAVVSKMNFFEKISFMTDSNIKKQKLTIMNYYMLKNGKITREIKRNDSERLFDK
jgi:hypothetical protein